MTVADVGQLLKASGKKFLKDKASRLGAALAYYTALSLAPLVVALVAIAGMVFGAEAARGEIFERLRDTTGPKAAAFVEQVVAKSASQTNGIIATVIAFAVVLIGASTVFTTLQDALNTIWKVPGRKAAGGVVAFLKERLLSFLLVGGAALLLLVSLAVSAVLSGINSRVAGWLPGMDVLAEVTNFVLMLVLTAALFAMIFKWLPETRLAWRDVAVGATVTALLFAIGRYLIGLYLGKAAVGSTFGAAGAFAVLLVWIYYSMQIMLLGAELTFVYAQRFGSGVRDADGQRVE